MWKVVIRIISETMIPIRTTIPLTKMAFQISGTKIQLLLEKTILIDRKRKHKNLPMAWVDYKKA